jgi:hypothetical protein
MDQTHISLHKIYIGRPSGNKASHILTRPNMEKLESRMDYSMFGSFKTKIEQDLANPGRFYMESRCYIYN